MLVPPQCQNYNFIIPFLFLFRNLTSVERQSLRLEEGSTGACLFTVARLQQFGDGMGPQLNMQANENEFVSRVGVDGRFTYVDPR